MEGADKKFPLKPLNLEQYPNGEVGFLQKIGNALGSIRNSLAGLFLPGDKKTHISTFLRRDGTYRIYSTTQGSLSLHKQSLTEKQAEVWHKKNMPVEKIECSCGETREYFDGTLVHFEQGEFIAILYESTCTVIDGSNGETIGRFSLPSDIQGRSQMYLKDAAFIYFHCINEDGTEYIRTFTHKGVEVKG